MNKYQRDIYRAFNVDLGNLSDEELDAHFIASQHEQRIFGDSNGDVELLSMKWLRGSGLEVGAGKYPTPLFGNASAVYGDCDEDLVFGGKKLDIGLSLDDFTFAEQLNQKFDFIIASHVLEHVDSFIRAVHNLVSSVRPGGIVYLVLPNKEFLNDKNFIPDYSFEHHKLEFTNPMLFAQVHDQVFIDANKMGVDEKNMHAELSSEYINQIKSGKISTQNRFLHHKHNYSYIGWVDVMLKTKLFLKNSFEIVDMRYGHKRQDCHFVLKSY